MPNRQSPSGGGQRCSKRAACTGECPAANRVCLGGLSRCSRSCNGLVHFFVFVPGGVEHKVIIGQQASPAEDAYDNYIAEYIFGIEGVKGDFIYCFTDCTDAEARMLQQELTFELLTDHGFEAASSCAAMASELMFFNSPTLKIARVTLELFDTARNRTRP